MHLQMDPRQNPQIFTPIRKELVMQSQDEVRRRVVENFGPMRLEACNCAAKKGLYLRSKRC